MVRVAPGREAGAGRVTPRAGPPWGRGGHLTERSRHVDQRQTVRTHDARFTCGSCGEQWAASAHDPSFPERVAEHQDSHQQPLDGPRYAHSHASFEARHQPIAYGPETRTLPLLTIILGALVAVFWVVVVGLMVGGWL